MPISFEQLSKEDLPELLHKFYGTVLSGKGKEYSKSGMINLRSGLNRHLTNPPYKRQLDLMQDQEFLQANRVYTGRLRDNKEKGLDVSQPREAMEKEDVEKLFNEYFLPGICEGNTEVLLHKIFFDIIYYTGRCGKEGLHELEKNPFEIKQGPDGVEFLQMTFNQKSKKNQGEATSAAVNSLHNDRNIIKAQDGELCPVKSFKKYVSLLNPKIEAFFQYPSDDKRSYTAKVVGKNSLGNMMSEISKNTKLSKKYTNHGLRKTTATAMDCGRFSLQQIANVTKHKNLDSLKHYLAKPTHEEKELYSDALHNYGKKTQTRPKRILLPAESNAKIPRQDATTPQPRQLLNAVQVQNEDRCVVLTYDDSESSSDFSMPQTSNQQNAMNNQLRQASNLFQNATFQNCQFSFNLPN